MHFRTTGGPIGTGRRLYFSAGSRIVVAEIEDRTLLEPVQRLFSEYEVVTPPAHEPTGPADVRLSVARGRLVVTSRDAPPQLCRSPMDAIVAFEFALSRALAATFVHSVHIHSAGAVVDGRAVLALGDSGAGKSSLAASMWAKGRQVLGDDTVFLGANATAAPFKRLLKVPRMVLEELGIDLSTTVHWDAAWPEAWLDPSDGPGWADEAPIAAVALVQYEQSAPLTIESVEAAEGLNALVHSVMLTGTPAAGGFDRLIRVAQSAKMYRLEFSSAVEAADILCSLAK